ncbi:hypothetical protein DICPUDRAFT_154324 [Dictyostelium purpureum]|uniref:NADH dehydrogenase [ubiquinone] 1 alpha subcomplex subunit 1 n=1 Tax=Dictyostelium purpureum TaxID=5786 RepID=F0ZR17_DICPU|nr:uncharacterized protein DICPUDRAFT_154324 [Dictyostelium purpureum]EGC33592.1 hypothetical protein DICPUDRAFT_154324 [Dictyostelium purpureum]|eukprot:XP_003289860.1 hypothetical protein DICPUDRAFT_154324 [Dictyostelium purpureum]
MTWLEVLPVFGIITGGLVVIGVGLDATHRLFHYGKPHRYNLDRVDYSIGARDEQILRNRAIKESPRRTRNEIKRINNLVKE